MKRLHIVGGKKHGKTVLVERLVREMARRGLRVGTVKHSSHPHDIDAPGTDSHRHRMAGASPAAFVASGGAAVFLPEEGGDAVYSRLAPMYRDCDLVLVEGDLETDAPKIEVHDASQGTAPLASGRDDILAVISDGPAADISRIADRILEILGGQR